MKLRSLAIFPLIAVALLFKACPAQAASHTVKLSWSAPASQNGISVTGYKVYRGTAAGGEAPTAYATITGNVVTFTDTAVTGGVTYFYTVSSVNACDSTIWDCSTFTSESVKSNEASPGAIPLPTAPIVGAPTAATAIVQ